jgi:osmotically-inducible protein OsmY
MKRTLETVSAILGALALSTLLGCASAGERTGVVIDDSVITTKVKAEILEHDQLKVFDIHVDTHDGIVQLRGVVNDSATADRAVQAARRVAGVREVRNDMRIEARS